MAKTKALIMLKQFKGSISNESEFVDFLFFEKNREALKTLAETMIKHLREFGSLPIDNNIRTPYNRKSYYTVLAKFKALGLIERKSNQYTVIPTLAKNLDKIASYAETIHIRAKEKRNENDIHI